MQTNSKSLACGLSLIVTLCAAFANAASPDSKQWADDLPAFINTHHQQRWIVGVSQSPALSADEAQQSAEHDAADRLAERIKSDQPAVDEPALRTALRSAIGQDPGWVVDRQVESKQRPYATVWAARVLVSDDPVLLAPLLKRIAAQRVVRQSICFAAGAAGLIWILVIASAYALLNLLTRGYLRGRLATLALLLLVVGLLGLGYIAHGA